MGGPYLPTTASLGGRPTVSLDIAICAVFLCLFIIGAACHMTIFQINKRRNHKFIPSAVTFGFCMSRIVATSLRIAWACHPTNINVAIASQIFVAAGVVILFILNLIYAQRVLRSTHPRIGWSRPVSWAFKALYFIVVVSIIMTITVVIQSFFTLDPHIRHIDRSIQLYAATAFSIISFLPLPILTLILILPNNKTKRQPLGKPQANLTTQIALIAFISVMLCLGASYRAGTSWMPLRPASSAPAYFHKACFYVFNFLMEIVVVYTFLLARVDKLFWVPDGSSGRRSYFVEDGLDGSEKGKEVESEGEIVGV